jgi:beta-N-acetylhexosaminidase
LTPRIPTRFSSHIIRGALCVFAISLVALVGCGGESSQSSQETSEKTRAATGETTQEVGQLALRDAVGQMFVVSMSGTEPDYYIEKMIRERNIGGILLFGSNMES